MSLPREGCFYLRGRHCLKHETPALLVRGGGDEGPQRIDLPCPDCDATPRLEVAVRHNNAERYALLPPKRAALMRYTDLTFRREFIADRHWWYLESARPIE